MIRGETNCADSILPFLAAHHGRLHLLHDAVDVLHGVQDQEGFAEGPPPEELDALAEKQWMKMMAISPNPSSRLPSLVLPKRLPRSTELAGV